MPHLGSSKKEFTSQISQAWGDMGVTLLILLAER